MQSIHEMYEALYACINAMPLPTSPDDPEPAEPEEYVEPEWYRHFGAARVEPEWEDAASRFEAAYEAAHEWDVLFPTYDLPKEPPVILFEDQVEP